MSTDQIISIVFGFIAVGFGIATNYLLHKSSKCWCRFERKRREV